MYRHLIHNQTNISSKYPSKRIPKADAHQYARTISNHSKKTTPKKKTDRVSAYYYDQTNPPSTTHSNKQGGIMVNLQLE
ncbi:hypothetical protein VTN49DRAFT_4067 [Thermomyces lanuginosus]|uniref:uncharacterized protein n=1 Tax=Thermomyces lanuginosus TaxID=5541 RepID=UPI0037423139